MSVLDDIVYVPCDPSNHGGTRTKDEIKYLVYHYTANDGDRAINNCMYYKNNVVKASAHYFVDDDCVMQSVPDLVSAWAVGGKKWNDCAETGGGKLFGTVTNRNSISIELCDTKKDGVVMAQPATLDNGIALGKMLMAKYDIPIERVIRHFDVTGKHCLPVEETELLTPNGWKYLRDVRVNDIVCAYDRDADRLRFEPVIDVVKQHSDEVFENHGFAATADHRMLVRPNCVNSKRFRVQTWGETLEGKGLYAVKPGALLESEPLPLTNDQIRLLVWIQGDGHYMRAADGRPIGVEFHVSKPRKIERVKKLLDDVGIPYRVSRCENGSEHIRHYGTSLIEWAEKWLDDKRFTFSLLGMSESQFCAFRDELWNVDGCKSVGKELYTSILPQNLDVVQALCATHGVRTSQGNLGAGYRCAVNMSRSNYTFSGRSETMRRKAIVSCVTVPSGYILVRQRYKTFVVGNCPAYFMDDAKWNEYKSRLVEDDMTIEQFVRDVTPKQLEALVDKMTNETCYTMLLKANEHAASLATPEWMKPELDEAVKAGITDGSRPLAMCMRGASAIMAMRAANERGRES